MARQTPIVIDPQDNPERSPILHALSEEEVVAHEGPALGMGGLPVSTGPLVVGPQVEAAEPAFFEEMEDAPAVETPATAVPVAETPVPVMVAVDEEDPWEDPPLRRSSGVPDWAPLSAMALCVLVSVVALADRLL